VRKQAAEDFNTQTMRWMAEADVPPNALSHDSWHRLVKLAGKLAETYKHPPIKQFSAGESRQAGVGKYLSKASAEAIKERMHYLAVLWRVLKDFR